MDGALWFNTGAETVKGRNLARTRVATICVQDDQPPFSFVAVEGTVELIDDVGSFAPGRLGSAAATWVSTAPRRR